MKPGPFIYHDPASIDDAVSLLGSLEDAKLLAGGQSLMPMLNMRFVQPDHVIDLNRVEGLAGIEHTGSSLRIGAMTRQAALMSDERVLRRAPVLAEALRWVGHFQTRSRGTMGGSLCHLDPAAEQPVVALLHDATLTVHGPDGARQVAMSEWPLAYMMPSIGPDELLTSIALASWDEPHGHAFEEYARRHGDFAIVAVGCLLAVRGGSITRAALAIGGARQTPSRLEEVERALIGQPANDATFRDAAALASKIDAMSDAYVTAQYRQRLAGVLTRRALARALKRTNGEA